MRDRAREVLDRLHQDPPETGPTQQQQELYEASQRPQNWRRQGAAPSDEGYGRPTRWARIQDPFEARWERRQPEMRQRQEDAALAWEESRRADRDPRLAQALHGADDPPVVDPMEHPLVAAQALYDEIAGGPAFWAETARANWDTMRERGRTIREGARRAGRRVFRRGEPGGGPAGPGGPGGPDGPDAPGGFPDGPDWDDWDGNEDRGPWWRGHRRRPDEPGEPPQGGQENWDMPDRPRMDPQSREIREAEWSILSEVHQANQLAGEAAAARQRRLRQDRQRLQAAGLEMTEEQEDEWTDEDMGGFPLRIDINGKNPAYGEEIGSHVRDLLGIPDEWDPHQGSRFVSQKGRRQDRRAAHTGGAQAWRLWEHVQDLRTDQANQYEVMVWFTEEPVELQWDRGRGPEPVRVYGAYIDRRGRWTDPQQLGRMIESDLVLVPEGMPIEQAMERITAWERNQHPFDNLEQGLPRPELESATRPPADGDARIRMAGEQLPPMQHIHEHEEHETPVDWFGAGRAAPPGRHVAGPGFDQQQAHPPAAPEGSWFGGPAAPAGPSQSAHERGRRWEDFQQGAAGNLPPGYPPPARSGRRVPPGGVPASVPPPGMPRGPQPPFAPLPPGYPPRAGSGPVPPGFPPPGPGRPGGPEGGPAQLPRATEEQLAQMRAAEVGLGQGLAAAEVNQKMGLLEAAAERVGVERPGVARQDDEPPPLIAEIPEDVRAEMEQRPGFPPPRWRPAMTGVVQMQDGSRLSVQAFVDHLNQQYTNISRETGLHAIYEEVLAMEQGLAEDKKKKEKDPKQINPKLELARRDRLDMLEGVLAVEEYPTGSPEEAELHEIPEIPERRVLQSLRQHIADARAGLQEVMPKGELPVGTGPETLPEPPGKLLEDLKQAQGIEDIDERIAALQHLRDRAVVHGKIREARQESVSTKWGGLKRAQGETVEPPRLEPAEEPKPFTYEALPEVLVQGGRVYKKEFGRDGTYRPVNVSEEQVSMSKREVQIGKEKVQSPREVPVDPSVKQFAGELGDALRTAYTLKAAGMMSQRMLPRASWQAEQAATWAPVAPTPSGPPPPPGPSLPRPSEGPRAIMPPPTLRAESGPPKPGEPVVELPPEEPVDAELLPTHRGEPTQESEQESQQFARDVAEFGRQEAERMRREKAGREAAIGTEEAVTVEPFDRVLSAVRQGQPDFAMPEAGHQLTDDQVNALAEAAKDNEELGAVVEQIMGRFATGPQVETLQNRAGELAREGLLNNLSFAEERTRDNDLAEQVINRALSEARTAGYIVSDASDHETGYRATDQDRDFAHNLLEAAKRARQAVARRRREADQAAQRSRRRDGGEQQPRRGRGPGRGQPGAGEPGQGGEGRQPRGRQEQQPPRGRGRGPRPDQGGQERQPRRGGPRGGDGGGQAGERRGGDGGQGRGQDRRRGGDSKRRDDRNGGGNRTQGGPGGRNPRGNQGRRGNGPDNRGRNS